MRLQAELVVSQTGRWDRDHPPQLFSSSYGIENQLAWQKSATLIEY